MFVTLIPLFLAAKISVPVTDWKYGPEVSYEVDIGSTAYFELGSETELNATSRYNWTTEMKCREKSSLVLSCYIYPLQELKNRTDNWSDSAMRPFELHFGNRGLDKIVCSSSLEPTVLDTIRGIADQLNVGADLSVVLRGANVAMENSTTGQCKTEYNTAEDTESASSEESDEDDDTNNYDIVVLLPGQRPLKDVVREIWKSRLMNDCTKQYRLIYTAMQNTSSYFMDSPVESLVEKQLGTNSTNFVSSKSHMTIKENCFKSVTTKKYLISNSAQPKPISLTESTEIKLDKIAPAKGPLPSIQDPTTVSIFPERWIRSSDNK